MLKSNSKRKILILMSGSIACYKVCSLISMLVKNEFEVKVAASKSALQFIGTATIEGLTGHKVSSDLWEQGSAMEHIQLERWADIIMAAPASAHLINRLAHGVGDDLLSTIFLAHEFKKPFLLAPAMNSAMYLHPTTQKSIQILNSLGIKTLETASGVLACGENGYGKLLDPELLYQEIQTSLDTYIQPANKPNAEASVPVKKILVTAGGTREAIDDVRYISNISTGYTGEKIASDLAQLGFDVTLDLALSSTTNVNSGYQLKRFDSFSDLSDLLQQQLTEEAFDLVIHTAAVSDYTVEKLSGKIESSSALNFQFQKTPKIVNSLKNWSQNKNLKLIAFKLTSNSSPAAVQEKVLKLMKDSNADFVVHNDIASLNGAKSPNGTATLNKTTTQDDRSNHQFQVFDKQKSIQVKGVPGLLGEILKEGLL